MTQVKIDGRNYDMVLAPELLELDGTDAGARARRDTAVLREIAKFQPQASEGQLEWGTDSQSGQTTITVSRQAKTKGLSLSPTPQTPLNPALLHLMHAQERVPAALTLAFTLKAIELNRRFDGPILLALQGRIEQARTSARGESERASRVFHRLAEAHGVVAPCEPIGF